MANDGKVVIELVGKDNATQTFVKSMQDMASSVKNLEASGQGLGSVGRMLGSLKGNVVSLAASFAGGLTVGNFLKEFDKLAASESALLKMAKRLNDTVENVSALGYVAKKSGMDADAFNIALERMQRNVSNAAKGVEQATGMVDEFGEPVGKAGKALDELGLRAEVLNTLPLPQKLKEISAAMKDNVDPADQARIALELFGKSGGGLVLALKEGPEAIQKWIDRYKELGGVLTTEGAEAMSKAKSAAGDLSIAWGNFSREMYEEVAPAITYVINRLTDLVVAAKKSARYRADIVSGVHTGDFGEWADEHGVGPPSLPTGGGGGGDWGEDIRKPPTRQAPAKPGGGGGRSMADDIQKEIDKLNKEVDAARKTAMDSINETWRSNFDLKQQSVQAIRDRVKLEADATKETSTLWDSVLGDEKLSYRDRLAAANSYKVARIQVIDDEITAIKEKYGALIGPDALESYRKSQINAVNKHVQSTINPEAFSWESAWKQAAANVQTSLSGTIFALMTQTKTAGDVITNITNSVLQIISEMAAQAIMNLAKMAMQSTSWWGGGGDGGAFAGASISGGVFAHGEVFQRFARGGVFHSPRVFPMAVGYGLMAEAGPEAVMPLTRIGGDLGVKVVGGGSAPVNITINNNAPNTQASAEQGPSGDIVVTIDQMTAKAYARRGSLYKAINSGGGATKR
jgi:hypothetical protein